ASDTLPVHDRRLFGQLVPRLGVKPKAGRGHRHLDVLLEPPRLVAQLPHLAKLREQQAGEPQAHEPPDHQASENLESRLGPQIGGGVAFDDDGVEDQRHRGAGERRPETGEQLLPIKPATGPLLRVAPPGGDLRLQPFSNLCWSRHYSSVFKTARNASWGISTEPTCFIRFLPSFCFSKSLRLRVMSPP